MLFSIKCLWEFCDAARIFRQLLQLSGKLVAETRMHDHLAKHTVTVMMWRQTVRAIFLQGLTNTIFENDTDRSLRLQWAQIYPKWTAEDWKTSRGTLPFFMCLVYLTGVKPDVEGDARMELFIHKVCHYFILSNTSQSNHLSSTLRLYCDASV